MPLGRLKTSHRNCRGSYVSGKRLREEVIRIISARVQPGMKESICPRLTAENRKRLEKLAAAPGSGNRVFPIFRRFGKYHRTLSSAVLSGQKETGYDSASMQMFLHG